MHRIFTDGGFGRVIRAGDSRRFNIDLKSNREAIVTLAISSANTGAISFEPIYKSTVKQRQCFSVKNYSHVLILRAITLFLSRRFRINPRSRDSMVKEVIETLSDSTPMHIIRRDIQSFYETLPIDSVKEQVLYSTFVPIRIKEFIKVFFNTFSSTSKGVPRGMGLSSIVSELAMRKTDRQIREINGVYKYFRYSDDILIFSTVPAEQIAEQLLEVLPKGMQFNLSKSSETATSEPKKGSAKTISVEYLGYKFSFLNHFGDSQPRKVLVSISERKLTKLKSKIICVFKSFSKTKDFYLLRDRVAFLASNYFAYRKGANTVRDSPYAKSGIYYNYHLCGEYQGEKRFAHDCSDLKAIDGFYNSLLRGSSSSFRSLFLGTLGAAHLKVMREISFYKGYQEKMMVRFGSDRVSKIKSAWRNA